MPEKEGAEEKSTKSVVNKKQKQMMGEEGYDIARDMGRVRPSKDKKDATTMPPSKEMEKTRKVNKGPSALDIIKKKYKGQIMKMEELDLTQVAEAFGGYIIEAQSGGKKKKIFTKLQSGEEEGAKAAVRTAVDRTVGGAETPEGQKRLKDIAKRSKIGPDTVAKFKKGLEQMKTGTRPVDDATIKGMGTETDREMDVRSQASKSDASRLAYNRYARELRRPEYDPLKPRKPRTIPFKDKPQLDTETQKKVDAVTPPFATKQGETGPLPVSMRNRRVPKTSSLSPNVKVTSIVKPTVGALTQTDFNKIVPFRRGTKTYNDFINPEIVDPGGPKPEKGGALGIDTGPTVIGQVIKDKPTKKDIKALEPPKIVGYIPPAVEKQEKPKETQTQTQTQTGGTGGGGKKTKVGNFSYRPGGPFSRIRGFARRNPALSLVGYDALKNLRVPSVTKPTKTGRVSAGT